MNEIQFHKMEEQSNAGTALLEELRIYCGYDARDSEKTVAQISRSIYKATACGAWLMIDEDGLSVGSIVEGSDVDCETHTLDWVSYLRMDEGDLDKWLNEALADIESEASDLWRDANEEEEKERDLEGDPLVIALREIIAQDHYTGFGDSESRMTYIEAVAREALDTVDE